MSGDITLNVYLDKLAARSPIPGGGSAAALVGALGVSLLSMVGRYLVQHKSTPTSRKKISDILKFAERSRTALRRLMTEDEMAYSKVAKGIKKLSIRDIVRLYKDAVRVPFEVCMISEEGLNKCEELCKYCKTSLVSDLAETALLLEAAFMSAKLNVDINLISISDPAYTKKIKNTLSKSRTKMFKTKAKILKKTRMQ